MVAQPFNQQFLQQGGLLLHVGQKVFRSDLALHGQRRRARRRVARIGVPVKKLDGVFRGGVHDSVVNLVLDRDGGHGHGAVGHRLGHGDDVRRDAEGLRGEGLAGTPEAADHFVEDQHDAVRVADFPEPLQIPLGRHQNPGGPGDGFDEARRDGAARLHLLTTTAGDFFRKLGYRDCPRDEAPERVASSREFAALCPASADYLVKRL